MDGAGAQQGSPEIERLRQPLVRASATSSQNESLDAEQRAGWTQLQLYKVCGHVCACVCACVV
jgi:hypothetical protein